MKEWYHLSINDRKDIIMISLNNGWSFVYNWSEAFLNGEDEDEQVRLPHTVKEIPLHYASPEYYETVSGYRRKLDILPEYEGKRIFLRFDGAAHIAYVFVNGKQIFEHRCGYTAFEVEITDYVEYNGDNFVAVKLDSTENPGIPPFGFVIDYLTFGGLYREVWLDVRPQTYISDIFVYTPDISRLKAKISIDGKSRGYSVISSVMDGDRCIATAEGTDLEMNVPEALPWNTEQPKLYVFRAELADKNGNIIHTRCETFGFRTAEFRADGFYLNGEKTFLRGLNRHQSYPYIGYAAPEQLQREDARILKNELKCTAVRTSHYPQSQYFIDECDRLGLLVFTEIPGWQHIGGDAWKDQAVENTREMVLQYRNHPSIILWGVRINESQDDDKFYKRTNKTAHDLDPSRATSGVRYLEKSHLLEDVYAFNDFSYDGTGDGAKKKSSVTPDMSKALLISENNGHMFPTKPFDNSDRRQEHALRHAKVQNAAAASGEHAGCFGWCMFDYPTHKDFGSGDRVCYHGVMDAFRNPKPASWLFSSQSDDGPFLEVSSGMDIGDYNAGKMTPPPYIFTNADETDLYKNGYFVKTCSGSEFSALQHGPVICDDLLGNLLETEEGFEKAKAAKVYECLKLIEKYGVSNIPPAKKLMIGMTMARYRISYTELSRLYGKYVSNWGGEATEWKFVAKKDGREVAEKIIRPGEKLHLDVRADRTELTEGDTYDMAAVRIRILDECGSTAPYAQLPVFLEVEGAAELVGPDVVTAEGGMCGCYLRSVGEKGEAKLTVCTDQTDPVEIEFIVN